MADLFPTRRQLIRHGPAFLFFSGFVAVVLRRQGWATALAVAFAGVATWILIPPLGRWFRWRRIVAYPGGRSSHRGFIPLAGGTAVFLPFLLVALPYAVFQAPRLLAVLAGAALLYGVGIWDDRHGVSARVKILAQLVAGSFLLLAGYVMSPLGLPGLGTLDLGPFGPPLLLFWVVLATNALNIIDGMDGLAAGVAVVALVGLTLLGVHPLAAALLAAALLGFLPHNLSKASVFLGDSGSLFVGFVIAALLLEVPHQANVALVAALFAYPLGDTGLAALRRFVRGKPIFRGDRSHIHHKLCLHFGSVRWAVVVVHAVAVAVMVVGLSHPSLRFVLFLLAGWSLTAATLVAWGRVRLGRVLGSRRPFRLMHQLRRYLDVSIRTARSPKDVEVSLTRLVQDLNLAAVQVNGMEIMNGGHDDPCCQWVPVRLPHGRGRWAYVPQPGEEGALEAERRAVVHEVLVQVDHRLSQFQAADDASVTANA